MINLSAVANKQIFTPVLAGLRGDVSFVNDLRSQGLHAYIVGDDISRLAAAVGEKNQFVAIVHRSGEETPLWNEVLPGLKNAGASVIVEWSVFGYPDRGPASNCADFVFCNSLHTLWRHWQMSDRPNLDEYLKRHTVLYYAVILNPKIEEIESARIRLRNALGIPQDAFVIGDVTRPDPMRLDFMLAAVLPRISKEIKNLHFIARRFPESLARTIAKKIGKRFHNLATTNNIGELIETYAAMDVFTHFSSMGESFGMVIAEAMRCGLPVVTNETPGLENCNAQTELVLHGKTGFIANDLVSVLKRLIELARSSELRRKLGAAGKERFEVPPLSPQSIIRQLESKVIAIARGKGWKISDVQGDAEPYIPEQQVRDYLLTYEDGASIPPVPRTFKEAIWNASVNIRRLAWRIRRRLL